MKHQIISIHQSPMLTKRFRVVLNDGSHYDFSRKGSDTYLDNHNDLKRLNYWKRHYKTANELHLIDNLIPSPALFSAYLSWGNYTDIHKNIDYLNKLWAKK